MIDTHLADVDALAAEGAVVLLKWDGQRDRLRATVMVTRSDTDYVWHQDTDDVGATLREAIAAYRKASPPRTSTGPARSSPSSASPIASPRWTRRSAARPCSR